MHRILARIQSKEKWPPSASQFLTETNGWTPLVEWEVLCQHSVVCLLPYKNILHHSYIFPTFNFLVCQWCHQLSPTSAGVWLRYLRSEQAHQDIPVHGSIDKQIHLKQRAIQQYDSYRPSSPSNIFQFPLLALIVHLWILEKKWSGWNVSSFPTLSPWRSSVIS